MCFVDDNDKFFPGMVDFKHYVQHSCGEKTLLWSRKIGRYIEERDTTILDRGRDLLNVESQ